MKSGRGLSVSLCLNLTLLGALALLSARRPHEIEAVPKPSAPVPDPDAISIPSVEPASAMHNTESRVALRWPQIESGDYRQYIANLRAIGCPEATIRDIIHAEVDELFSRRVKDLVDTVQYRFWDLLVSRQEFEDMVEEKHKQLNQLDDEREILLKELLGSAGTREGYRRDEAAFERETDQRRVLDFLPSEKLSGWLVMDAQFERARQELSDSEPRLEGKELQTRLQQLKEQQTRGCESLLSPEELVEYGLRTSKAAEIRFRLGAFEITETEMREVAAIEQRRAETRGGTARVQPAGPDTAIQDPDAQLKALLGEDRFAGYRLAQDTQFQEFYQVTQRLQLPEDAAVDAYAIREAAESAARAVKADTALSEEARREQFDALTHETEQALVSTLGSVGTSLYKNRWGQWFTAMGAR
jgi:hypothetical protein